MQLTLIWPLTVDIYRTYYFPASRWEVVTDNPRGYSMWHFLACFNAIGDQAMARKGKNTNRNNFNNNFNFLNWKPAPAERKALDSWLSADDEIVRQEVDNLALSGMKLTIVFVPDIDAFTIAVTPRDEGDVNYGTILSLKSGDWYRGICAAAFFCSVVSKNGEWESRQNDDII